ncbi:hypothetical protein J7I98_23850 [Streptomyces sp. ISL-98]|uniref:hypothetical protein n=1 Tax=Streptomyces sp. ISL-98 TaxID=2819192 RepID=UPI001BE75E6D|nr:hypothetical protein [Streptomyces sp. ISL-98]MBT2508865.1 hypothetical protein [Streptomyces sp. ISL-98]
MNYPAERMTPAAAPARVGQGTAVEQSRAVAEVQAAIIVAQQCPRDINNAIAEMRQSCQQMFLAERAFFRYSRGSGNITGPSVHLARELARCWGNIQYGLVEMRRDDEFGQSEMQAFAWDVEKNSRNSSTFIVPHKRDQKGGPKQLTDMRDIYENNANNGARRVREAIFAILPPWFVEEAKQICTKTLSDGGGKPLPQRIADAIRAFEGIGVTQDRIETKLGRPSGKWTEHDVAQLLVAFQSIQRGEVTADEEFPLPRVTVDEIQQQAATAAPSADSSTEWPTAAQPGSGARA